MSKSGFCQQTWSVVFGNGLQNIAPAEAGNGPNPEYPWPHNAPLHCPADHAFTLWQQLLNTGQGRKLMEIIIRAVTKFDAYA